LGKGLPLIIFGTFGAQALPRAGAWMISIKQVFGFVFFALAVWTADPLLAEWIPMILWAVLAMAAAVFLGAFDVTKGRVNPTLMGLQALGLLASVYSVLLIVGLAGGSVDPLQPLEGIGSRQVSTRVAPVALVSIGSKSEFTSQLNAAGSAGRASLVYFTADWCVSCRSIDRNVFSRPEVIDALSPLKTLKVDLTHITPAQRALMRELEVVGPPTMILFRPDHQQAVDGRLIGEFSASDVLKAVAAAKAGT
jgi:thiol:disulfide interchange protein DsbD